jgi:hypothetical protein
MTFAATKIPTFAGGLSHDQSLEGEKQSCLFLDISFSVAHSDEFIENQFAVLMECVVNR